MGVNSFQLEFTVNSFSVGVLYAGKPVSHKSCDRRRRLTRVYTALYTWISIKHGNKKKKLTPEQLGPGYLRRHFPKRHNFCRRGMNITGDGVGGGGVENASMELCSLERSS